jgi:hypothetical protein
MLLHAPAFSVVSGNNKKHINKLTLFEFCSRDTTMVRITGGGHLSSLLLQPTFHMKLTTNANQENMGHHKLSLQQEKATHLWV